MAGAKVLKKRIAVVRNTRKITRTMEMVSTAKSKRMVTRVNASRPYNEKILEIMESMEHLAGETVLPLLRTTETPHRIGILVVTANRGLCGGYNANVLRMARNRIVEHQKLGREVEIVVIGKKGSAYFKFLKLPMKQVIIDIDDAFQYDQAKQIADSFISDFSMGHYDGVEVISTIYVSSVLQKPIIDPILPVGTHKKDESSRAPKKEKKNHSAFLFEPDPKFILKRILPHVIRATIFRKILEAVTSEQIFRRIAMKNASDNAGEMTKLLSRTYNRKRQAGITQELAEIVSGADAIG
ncbi:MAG: ATP synthase F1 subunit gamma [Spirochaetia bacterium]|nr:ATP synthase F1 subunit gamma [Spirochaetia bacterium]